MTTTWASVRHVLSSIGLLNAARVIRVRGQRLFRLVSRFDHRRREAAKRHYEHFAGAHGSRLKAHCSAGDKPGQWPGKPALILGRIGRSPEAQVMLVTLLREAGYAPTILLLRESEGFLRPFYELAGVKMVNTWPSVASSAFFVQAQEMLRGCTSLQALLDLDDHGVRVGRSALSMTLRASQVGLLDLDGDARDPRLVPHLADALAASATARQLLQRLAPVMTMSYEMEYTPKRELFDASLAAGAAVVTAYRAPRRDALLLKRYTRSTNHRHPSSLSDASWHRLQQMPWTVDRRRELADEVRGCYEQGDWWGIPTAGSSGAAVAPEDVRQRLGLDSSRKTACIFPHVPWDASFAWGEDLFADYQTWLIETVRAACENSRVNWVVRVHPANADKSAKVKGGAAPIEIGAIRQRLGGLPAHVVLLPADSGLSTLALFRVMDYCLTVRGTVGLEAASLGIPVLTGGTGRYDRRGFTIDSMSSTQYLERVRHIEDIPPMTGGERELAERFAYGMFVQRPLPLEPALLRALTAPSATLEDAWRGDRALVSFVEWLRDPSAEDFLMPLPGASAQS